jgi:hypothetical protein
MLTGAGMSQTEAERQVAQYEPGWNDDDKTLGSKLDGLVANTNAAAKAIQEGRKPVMTPLNADGTPGTPAAPGGGTAAPAASTHVNDVTEIPEDKVLLLRNDPTPENQQYFDEAFGAGMAAKVLGGVR